VIENFFFRYTLIYMHLRN